MHPRPAQSFSEVRASIERFNADLLGAPDDPTASRLIDRLPFVRAWYYLPEREIVGPSKFIGYEGMTAEWYVKEGSLDGRETEPVLQRWFRPLDPGSPEEAVVRSKVEELLARYGKSINRAARFCAPIGWRVAGRAGSSEGKRLKEVRGRHTIHATITRGETHFVAECDHLAVVTQGRTVDETIENLKEAVALHLEGEDLDKLGLAPEPIILVMMELHPWAA